MAKTKKEAIIEPLSKTDMLKGPLRDAAEVIIGNPNNTAVLRLSDEVTLSVNYADGVLNAVVIKADGTKLTGSIEQWQEG